MRGSLDSDLVNRVCCARVRKQQHREVVGSGGTCCILTLRFLLANLNRPLTGRSNHAADRHLGRIVICTFAQRSLSQQPARPRPFVCLRSRSKSR